jgi:hypothetical protein
MRELTEADGTFAEVWAEKLTTDVAALARSREERRQRRMLALTDAVLGQLEQRNLAGQHELDEGVRRHIARTLVMLAPDARRRFPAATTVQEALDGMFEVQAAIMLVLQRILHWEHVLTAPA